MTAVLLVFVVLLGGMFLVLEVSEMKRLARNRREAQEAARQLLETARKAAEDLLNAAQVAAKDILDAAHRAAPEILEAAKLAARDLLETANQLSKKKP